MPKGIVDPAKVVQVQATERQTLPLMLGQARCEQRLKTLAIGDAGQRVLYGQPLQRALQVAPFARITHTAPHQVRVQTRAG